MKDLGVWITRLQAGAFVQQLQAQAIPVLHMPTLELKPIHLEPKQINYLHQPIDFIVWVSPMAVQYGLPLLPATALASATIIAVGQGTHAQLSKCGILDAVAPDHGEGSEAVLALPVLQAIAGKTIVIVAGEGGRTVLAETLSARGATVHTLLCYARHMPTLDLPRLAAHQKVSHQQMIVATSATALEYLVAQLPAVERAFWQQQTLLVGSQRVAAIAQQLGFSGEIINASGASDAALMTALMAWYGHNQPTTK